ncbi:MAG TPA: uroporphyrinogen-III synthase [Sphingomicrobium sp.]|nr:uroporphyrinogen-III synthase [Sphingomicrobium sp.]
MKRVLVLRPEPSAKETVSKARQRGLDALALPLFKIEPVAWDMPDLSRFDALLLTSANAVRRGGAGLAHLQGLPVHAVGNATADAARNAGFAVASTGDAGVDALLASLEPGLRLLHLCGEDRRAPADARREIRSLVVYRSRESSVPNISAAKDCVALIHSPRAGRRFAGLIDQAGVDRGRIGIVAISPAAAEAADGGWAAVAAAETPNDDALLALAERLCNKLGT